MPSKKPTVLSYLGEDEYKAFKEFKREKGLSNSEAVNYLIKNHLIEKDDSETEKIHHLYNERLKRVEASFNEWLDKFFEQEKTNDWLRKFSVSTSEERVKVWSRLNVLDNFIDKVQNQSESIIRKNQKLADFSLEQKEKLNTLEDKVNELKMLEERRFTHWLEDEQIAAITGQSVWKVRLWRYGHQKPRGKRIKAKLSAYEVVDGKWKKRDL